MMRRDAQRSPRRVTRSTEQRRSELNVRGLGDRPARLSVCTARRIGLCRDAPKIPWPWIAVAVLCAAVGCGSAEGPADAAVDAVSEGQAPDASPDAGGPALPRLQDWDCPDGWAAETAAENLEVAYRVCQPPEQFACPPGQAQFLGQLACGPIGTACPVGSDRFIEETTIRKLAAGFGGKLLYVDPGAQQGDGSRDRPLPAIGSTLWRTLPGDIVVLSRAAFDEPVLIDKAIALVGSCVAGTTLRATSAGETQGMVRLSAGGAMVANLRISGPSIGVSAKNQTGRVALSAIEVLEARATAILLTGAGGAELTDVVVRDTRSRSDQTYGHGLMIRDAGSVSAARVVIERTREFGVGVGAGAEATLADLVVRDTLSQETARDGGRGLHLQQGGRATIERALFERNRDAAVSAYDPGTRLELTDVVVRDTLDREMDRRYGCGLEVVDGAEVAVRRGAFDRNRTFGIAITAGYGPALKTPPALSLADVLIRDTQAQRSDSAWGVGLAAGKSSQVEVVRTLIARNRAVGIKVGAEVEPPTVRLEDVVIWDTRSDAQLLSWGQGLSVADGAEVTASRLLLASNRQAAIYLGNLRGDVQTRASLTDLSIRDTAPAACAELPLGHQGRCIAGQTSFGGGSGLVVAGNSRAQLEAFEIARSAACGIQVASGGQVDAREGRVHHNAVGVNVQAPDYDLDTLANDTVRYHDNDSNLVSEKLPVPEPPPPL